MPHYTSLPDSEPDPNAQPLPPPTSTPPSPSPSFQTYGLKIAKWVYIFDLLRIGIMVVLLGLNVDATIITKDRVVRGLGSTRSTDWDVGVLAVVRQVGGLSGMQKVELGVTVFYALNLGLAIIIASIRTDTPARRTIQFIFHILLFLALSAYTYRDLYPLITYSKHPLDPEYLPQPLVWVRFSFLTLVGFVLPLLQPSQYRPVDPFGSGEGGDHEPNPEQTASLVSYVFYIFMDKIIWRAWRSSAIPYEDLPPLPDYDRAAWLARNSLLKLHPIRRQELGLKPRGLFICLMSVYWKTYLMLALMLLIKAIMEFAAPIGINRLLTYLQSGETGDIHPWFWIVWLFLGPTAASLAWQYYVFLTTRSLVHVESLFTQLLFGHALRIKMQDPVDGAAAGAGAGGNKVKMTLAGANTPAVGPGVEDGQRDESPEVPVMVINNDNGHARANSIVPGSSSNDSSSSDEDTVVGSHNKKEGSVKSTTNGSGGNKPKHDDDDDDAPVEEEQTAGLVGRLTTLASTDLENIIDGRDFLMAILYGPLQLVLGAIFLYQILSWSALVGMAVTLITLPIPGYLAGLMNATQQDLMKATDSRIQTITEAVNTLRMVKLFAWEEKISERISEKRAAEMKQVKRKAYVDKAIGTANWMLPIFTMITCYGLYTGVQKRTLTAAQVFSSLTVFDMIRGQMYTVTSQLQATIAAKVSIGRMDTFLRSTEMLDEYKDEIKINVKSTEEQGKIYFKHAEFSWENAETRAGKSRRGTATAKREWKLSIEDLEFPLGKTTVVAGKTSSGKTSLLMALLGEMNWAPTRVDAAFNLPRSGGIAYAAQEAWVMANTVRENIIFGEPFDAARYQKVLHACALEKDLELFDAGDQTELGEKGLNASGGQKARISLARAVYSDAQTLLLDSVLEALDVTTSRWIVEKLFRSDLLTGRTVILVTHHVALVAPVTDYVVHMAVGGTIDHQGPIDQMQQLIDDEPEDAEALAENIEQPISEAHQVDKPAQVTPAKEDNVEDGKLVTVEEKGEGRVSRAALISYFKLAGGPVYWTIYYVVIFVGEILFAVCNWWLGEWSRAYETTDDPRKVSIVYWLGMYVLLMVLQLGCYNASSLQWMFGAIRASTKMHANLVHHILHAPMRFLDKTPTGRILGRFTKDMNSIDATVVDLWQGVSEITITLALKAIILVWIVPVFGPIGLVIAILGFGLAELYIHGQLSVKREMSNAKTPLYSSFNAAVNGVISIRAYGAQEFFSAELRSRCDKYTRCCVTYYNLNRWITVRMDLLGGLFSAGLAALLVYNGNGLLPASIVGFAINQAVSFSNILLYFVRMINQFEVQANGIERINDYLMIDQEPAPTERGMPPAAWPTTGEIRVEHLKARYFEGGPVVLDDLSFDIPAGSRIGIVGRTGSGKSSLTLALLRMIPTEGSIKIAGIDSKSVNLNALRSAVSIIPQEPTLLSGTLRFNLDPFDEHDDYELNEMIKTSGLEMATGEVDDESSASALTLDSKIASGGSNLSAGQRQLVALARALVRGSKILVLDEATASVDHATDGLVQTAIRNLKDITLLIVAHRLTTIGDSDKILVLGQGKMLEYDTPKVLLENKQGHYHALCNDSHEKEQLYALAEGTGREA